MDTQPRPTPPAHGSHLLVGHLHHPRDGRWHPVVLAPELRAYAAVAQEIIVAHGGRLEQPPIALDLEGGRR